MEMYYFTKVALFFAYSFCVHCSKAISKPGKCPRVFNTLVPAQPCVHDGCCPGEEKCCSFVGGSVCAPPIMTQPGCPDTEGRFGVCAELCQSDKDCQWGEKCCFNGCGRECISTVKPGNCGSPWVFFWCGDYCQNDSDCPEHMKCCPSIWGHVCKVPHLPRWD